MIQLCDDIAQEGNVSLQTWLQNSQAVTFLVNDTSGLFNVLHPRIIKLSC